VFDNLSEKEIRIAIRQAYEKGDHSRKLSIFDGSYIEEADVKQICFLLGDFSEDPNLFRALSYADKESLAKALQFCSEKGFIEPE